MDDKPKRPPRHDYILRMVDSANLGLNEAFENLLRAVSSEIMANRLPANERRAILKELGECQRRVQDLAPDAKQRLQALQRRFEGSKACQALVEKIWEITTLK